MLLLLSLPAALHAQFQYETNASGITITRYTGPGGEVTIPDTIDGLPVTSIGEGAFSSCSNLISVTISDGVTGIGRWAFINCAGLTSVTIGSSVTNIGNYAFIHCASLSSVVFPESITSISADMFSGCTGLRSVFIPGSVTNIMRAAFSTCTNLTSVYCSGNAPATYPYAFWGASKATVYYLPGTTGWGKTFDQRPTALWTNPAIMGGTLGLQANALAFTIAWAPDATVVVEASPALTNPTWSPVSTNVLTGGVSVFSDPEPATQGARFYRLRSP